jgi:hypothetical protein
VVVVVVVVVVLVVVVVVVVVEQGSCGTSLLKRNLGRDGDTRRMTYDVRHLKCYYFQRKIWKMVTS